MGNPSGVQPASPRTGNRSLLDLIAEVTGERPSGTQDSLRLTEDLHLDSLGRVQLQSSLEQQLGLEFAGDALSNLETLGQLRALIAAETSRAESPLRRVVSIFAL